MMPVTGGYYQWVKRALGLRWAFFEGWWTWLYTFTDLAIYPVLFVTYLSFFFPGADVYKIPICLVIIWGSAAINILGIVSVGRASIILSALVLIPFGIMFGYFIYTHHAQMSVPELNFKGKSFSAIGIGLYTVLWNFIGWDNVTTYAGEVHKPVRSYLVSVLMAFLLVFGIYFIATLVAINTGISPETLDKNGFPSLGVLLGGRILGMILAAGGMASMLGLYSAVLLSVSRIPKVMSDDGLLPKLLNKLHPKYRSPYVSILCCSVIVSGMVLWSFGELMIIDITLYGAALFLEYIALIKFRIVQPEAHRPFRIPLGVPGLIIMALLPFAVYSIAVSAAFVESGSTLKPVLFAVFALAIAEVGWQIVRWNKKKKDSKRE